MFMCNVTSLCLPANKNALKSLLRIRSMSCSVWHVRYTLHMISEHINMQLLLEDPKMDSYCVTDTFCSSTSIKIGNFNLLLTFWSPCLFWVSDSVLKSETVRQLACVKPNWSLIPFYFLIVNMLCSWSVTDFLLECVLKCLLFLIENDPFHSPTAILCVNRAE